MINDGNTAILFVFPIAAVDDVVATPSVFDAHAIVTPEVITPTNFCKQWYHKFLKQLAPSVCVRVNLVQPKSHERIGRWNKFSVYGIDGAPSIVVIDVFHYEDEHKIISSHTHLTWERQQSKLSSSLCLNYHKLKLLSWYVWFKLHLLAQFSELLKLAHDEL